MSSITTTWPETHPVLCAYSIFYSKKIFILFSTNTVFLLIYRKISVKNYFSSKSRISAQNRICLCQQSSHRSITLSVHSLALFLRVGQTEIRNHVRTGPRRLFDFVCSRLFRSGGRKTERESSSNQSERVRGQFVGDQCSSKQRLCGIGTSKPNPKFPPTNLALPIWEWKDQKKKKGGGSEQTNKQSPPIIFIIFFLYSTHSHRYTKENERSSRSFAVAAFRFAE